MRSCPLEVAILTTRQQGGRVLRGGDDEPWAHQRGTVGAGLGVDAGQHRRNRYGSGTASSTSCELEESYDDLDACY